MKSLFCVATLCTLALPVGIAAQTPGGSANTPPDASPGTGGGQGGGSGPGGSSVGSNGTASPAFPQFGTWLDDASLEGRGTGRVTIGAGYWRMADGHQIDVPMIDAGYDLSDRIHVSAFVPFYRARYGTELTTGVDDMSAARTTPTSSGGRGRGTCRPTPPRLAPLTTRSSRSFRRKRRR